MIPKFIIETDSVGLGYCVVAKWRDGRREVVTGFGDQAQATRWIEQDSAGWLANIPGQESGGQWINNRLPPKNSQ